MSFWMCMALMAIGGVFGYSVGLADCHQMWKRKLGIKDDE